MKKQQLYKSLQEQYNKLNSRIQKAIKTGRFAQLTQFKQDRLFGRLQRYSLQMKRVAAGVAVVAALGVSTPVMGQLPTFIRHEGASNPIHNLNLRDMIGFGGLENHIHFVDLDGDGDKDLFANNYSAYYEAVLEYYENTGTATNPSFTLATNPLPKTIDVHIPEFADLDNDGDLDCFASGFYNHSSNNTVMYFENTGTVNNPVFVERTGANNPLDTINTMYPTFAFEGYLWSGDFNNDGDIEFWWKNYNASPSDTKTHYCENQGTASVPNLVVRPTPQNIQQFCNFAVQTQDPRVVDMDGDGDLDIISGEFRTGANAYQGPAYYENTGNAGVPIFATTRNAVHILDSIPNLSDYRRFEIVDIDGDTDLDVFAIGPHPAPGDYIYYFENRTITTGVKEIKENGILSISPNPSTGIINFQEEINGFAGLYNIAGQKVFEKELFGEKVLNLSHLENGLYFLEIQTEKTRTRTKIILQK